MDKPFHNCQPKKLQKIGPAPQVLEATEGISVYELVSYGRFPHQNGLGHLTDQDREKINWALKSPRPPYARLPVDDLSGGQRQRVDCDGTCPRYGYHFLR